VSAGVHERELALEVDSAAALVVRLRERARATLWLAASAGPYPGWNEGSDLIALEPRPLALPSSAPRMLDALERRLLERRAAGGTASTGLALVLSYEALDGIGEPAWLALEVDRSLSSLGRGRFRLTERAPGHDVERLCSERAGEREPAQAIGAPRSSLDREAWLQAVDTIREHIREGDIYQANLCRVLVADYRGDPAAFHAALDARTPAPRSAFVESDGIALASFSPEVFLRVEPTGRIETWPIKGTRARSADPVVDREAAEDLLRSEKDRAELLMIVDLERNDLGRVCRTGSVRTTDLARLVSFPTVHHLVGRVEGALRDDTTLRQLLEATFPGGSISGAPKRRAREILSRLEPCARGAFTGSLLWLGDDGSLDSSILIRSAVFERGRVCLGAGCGIVADSDPEAEWVECLHKLRAPAEALGLELEEPR
jgi:anthranilate/para-aminobenzoate synthase component I